MPKVRSLFTMRTFAPVRLARTLAVGTPGDPLRATASTVGSCPGARDVDRPGTRGSTLRPRGISTGLRAMSEKRDKKQSIIKEISKDKNKIFLIFVCLSGRIQAGL